MNNIKWLQKWYQTNCDGIWEHTYGIEIGTLDNPGWYIKIDISETSLQDRAHFEFKEQIDEYNWIMCNVKDRKFTGYGDSTKLEKIIEIFKEWVEN